jgi:hypothetical protein
VRRRRIGDGVLVPAFCRGHHCRTNWSLFVCGLVRATQKTSLTSLLAISAVCVECGGRRSQAELVIKRMSHIDVKVDGTPATPGRSGNHTPAAA